MGRTTNQSRQSFAAREFADCLDNVQPHYNSVLFFSYLESRFRWLKFHNNLFLLPSENGRHSYNQSCKYPELFHLLKGQTDCP